MSEMNTMRGKLCEEIEREIENLSKLTPGDPKHTAAVEAVNKLYRLNIEDISSERAFMENCDRTEIQVTDQKLKKAEIDERKLDRYFRYGTEFTLGLLGLGLTAVFTDRGFKFEENGTYTSWVLKNIFPRFKR